MFDPRRAESHDDDDSIRAFHGFVSTQITTADIGDNRPIFHAPVGAADPRVFTPRGLSPRESRVHVSNFSKHERKRERNRTILVSFVISERFVAAKCEHSARRMELSRDFVMHICVCICMTREILFG